MHPQGMREHHKIKLQASTKRDTQQKTPIVKTNFKTAVWQKTMARRSFSQPPTQKLCILYSKFKGLCIMKNKL